MPLKELQARFSKQDAQSLVALQDSGQFIGGDFVSTFESSFATYCDVTHCVGTANGLDALTLILKADCQLGNLPQNARILVPAHTYIATWLSIVHAGMQPVPVDVKVLNLDVEVVSQAMGTYDGIIAVDIYGKMVDDSVYAFAKANQIPIYCDTAQSHGATSISGKRSGSIARASAFSFYPTKNLGALGDAGAITTNDTDLAFMCRNIANYGRSSRFVNDQIGMNSRLDPLQALFLSTRLKSLDSDNAARFAIARAYYDAFKNEEVSVLSESFLVANACHVFPVFVDDRRRFVNYMTAHNIETSCHYEIPPHRQKAFESFNKMSFPVTDRLHDTQVSIPCHPLLNAAALNRICTVINAYS